MMEWIVVARDPASRRLRAIRLSWQIGAPHVFCEGHERDEGGATAFRSARPVGKFKPEDVVEAEVAAFVHTIERLGLAVIEDQRIVEA